MLSQDNLQSVIGNAAQRKGKRSSVLQQLNELKSSRSKETNRVKEKTATEAFYVIFDNFQSIFNQSHLQ